MGLIRFLLAVAVAWGHLMPSSFFIGKTAVQVFYIISGFYMSLILNEKYVKQKNAYQLFISNRLLKLYPTYWVVLFLTLLISLLIYWGGGNNNALSLTAYFKYGSSLSFTSITYLIITNIFLFFQDVVTFLGLNKTSGNLYFTSNFYASNPPVYNFLLIPQAWTIGIELLYYLVAPLIVRRHIILTIALILLSIGLRVILINQGLSRDPWNYRFFPTELVFFLLGNISYRFYIFFKDKIWQYKHTSLYLKLIFLTVILFTLFYEEALTLFNLRYVQMLYFSLFVISLPFIFILTKKVKADRFIGELSYPIYISHMLIINIINFFEVHQYKLLLMLTICILFSIMINKLLIQKIEKFRQSRINKA